MKVHIQDLGGEKRGWVDSDMVPTEHTPLLPPSRFPYHNISHDMCDCGLGFPYLAKRMENGCGRGDV